MAGRAVATAARELDSAQISKDSDFVELVMRHGGPPNLIWRTCRNESNAALQTLFNATPHGAIQLLEGGLSIFKSG